MNNSTTKLIKSPNGNAPIPIYKDRNNKLLVLIAMPISVQRKLMLSFTPKIQTKMTMKMFSLNPPMKTMIAPMLVQKNMIMRENHHYQVMKMLRPKMPKNLVLNKPLKNRFGEIIQKLEPLLLCSQFLALLQFVLPLILWQKRIPPIGIAMKLPVKSEQEL